MGCGGKRYIVCCYLKLTKPFFFVLLVGDNDIYEEVFGDCVSPLINDIKHCFNSSIHQARINNRGDISKETLDYFLVENPRG